ncbi:MAG: hypothetical protein ACREFX_08120 [Opitutaceae bacterium]
MFADPKDEPLVYLILGAAGSGRREVLADLLEGGLEESEKAAVLIGEREAESSASERLIARAGLARWKWLPATGERAAGSSATRGFELPPAGAIDATVPPGAARIFFLTDGRSNPVDQIEAFKVWSTNGGLRLGRIICVVDCRLVEAKPPLRAWFEACIHFSDIVLLNRREGVSNKWVSDFQARFKRLHYPCLIEFVKNGTVRNPALILDPQALRISHVFDEEADWTILGADGKDPEDDEEAEGEEAVELRPEEDPYFARWSGGRRMKEIPDIAKYLDPIPAG